MQIQQYKYACILKMSCTINCACTCRCWFYQIWVIMYTFKLSLGLRNRFVKWPCNSSLRMSHWIYLYWRHLLGKESISPGTQKIYFNFMSTVSRFDDRKWCMIYLQEVGDLSTPIIALVGMVLDDWKCSMKLYQDTDLILSSVQHNGN